VLTFFENGEYKLDQTEFIFLLPRHAPLEYQIAQRHGLHEGLLTQHHYWLIFLATGCLVYLQGTKVLLQQVTRAVSS